MFIVLQYVATDADGALVASVACVNSRARKSWEKQTNHSFILFECVYWP